MNTSDVRVPKFVFKDKHINFPGEGSGLSFTDTENHKITNTPTLYGSSV